MAGINYNPTPYYYYNYRATSTGGVTGTPSVTDSPTGTSSIPTVTTFAPYSASNPDNDRVTQLTQAIANLTAEYEAIEYYKHQIYVQMNDELADYYAKLNNAQSVLRSTRYNKESIQNIINNIQQKIDEIYAKYSEIFDNLNNKLNDIEDRLCKAKEQLDNYSNFDVDFDISVTGTVTVTVTSGNIQVTQTTAYVPDTPTTTTPASPEY